jgi:hypothetical protein
LLAATTAAGVAEAMTRTRVSQVLIIRSCPPENHAGIVSRFGGELRFNR